MGYILVLVVCHSCPHKTLLSRHPHTAILHTHHLVILGVHIRTHLPDEFLLLTLTKTRLVLKSIHVSWELILGRGHHTM